MLKRKDILNEAGSLMIEAMAMLALIAMVTPILYKKAAERTTELQDINAASQMRVMSKAMDDYIRTHYNDIVQGGKVTTDCGDNNSEQDYAAMKDSNDAAVEVNVGHLCEFLPYGFVDEDGNVRGSKTFATYQLAIKKRAPENESAGEGGEGGGTGEAAVNTNASLTGFIIADPKTPLPMLRSARIASMIGSNGGYTQGKEGLGVQGVWRIEDIDAELGLEPKEDGSIMAASIQSINSNNLDNPNVLYRNEVPGHPEYNTMNTALDMGSHDINNVNSLIITADNPANGADMDTPLVVEKGGIQVEGKIDAADGKFVVDTGGNMNMAGNADIGGGITAGGNANIGGNAVIDGTLDAAGGNFTVDASGNTNIAGDTTIQKNITVEGDSNVKGDSEVGKNLHVYGTATIEGDTTINSNLKVAGDTTTNTLNVTSNANVGGDLNVAGNTTTNTLNVTSNADIGGDLNVAGNAFIGKDLEVNGILRANDFRSKTLQGGLIGQDWADNPDNDKFGFTAYWAQGDPNRSLVVAGPNNEFSVTNKQILVDNVDFTVQRNAASGGGDIIMLDASRTDAGDDYVHILKDGAGALLTVSNNTAATTDLPKGSVHIRRGVLEVATKYGEENAETIDAGYIKADRFVDNYSLNPNALPSAIGDTGYTGSGVTATYDAYQVNPAYTSVMHDIKLTSRGGARLSDILPDFINKGIYVVDNSYTEDVPYWGSSSLGVQVSGDRLIASGAEGESCTSHTCWTSPWLGLIPAPICPPGYARVVTISPAGWAMAQAGVPGSRVGNNRQDLLTPDYPKNPHDYNDGEPGAPTPLYFQKSTWLRTSVYPHGSKGDFLGWSAIMGFMYPYTYYKDYIDDLGLKGDAVGGVNDNQLIIWNLFPVLRRQLEAYVTVYCYFDRTNGRYDPSFVDKYDQLNDFRQGWSKAGDKGSEGTYLERLNDETLPYDDPW